jgi:hypothetical protein
MADDPGCPAPPRPGFGVEPVRQAGGVGKAWTNTHPGLVIEETSEEEANQESDHDKQDHDEAWNVAHTRLP